ncbi:MAG: cache domain-containing protein [Candidatus Eisenbacteria bacterium]|uniref:histidine kinase n=1 Tax=Eiseniibacteriota bacterium TaxID=2212470 RepID=A0A956NM74_UNCEI|nr:cache domain-containing protein [Candidatus Eisenbacteria bacterium]
MPRVVRALGSASLRRLRRISLQARLIGSYLVILAIGGLATSLVGSWIVSSTIMDEAQRRAERNLSTAHTIFEDEAERLRQTVDLLAREASDSGEDLVAWSRRKSPHLMDLRLESGFDLMAITDASGHTIARMVPGTTAGDDAGGSALVRAALHGTSAAGVEVLPSTRLASEGLGLVARARIEALATPRAESRGRSVSTDGLVLFAAAPVVDPGGEVAGTIYAGVLLNRNFAIVDRIWDVLYRGETFEGNPVGSVTIFQGPLRIATTIELRRGGRAVGTFVSDVVGQTVLAEGRPFGDRAFVVEDWYRAAYEPIRSPDGDVVGILYVGVLERYYAQLRNQVILSFFAIAGLGFLAILGVTYGFMGNTLRPVREMAVAARRIAKGDLDHTIGDVGVGEVAILGEAFNSMLESIRRMRADLETWGSTLEQKVEERTQELFDMQSRMARADRLASVGVLSAGVAHEINNPLGGVLALTALTLEDLPADDPSRENLEEVVRQAERCKRIVKGLLDFSRQSANSPEPVALDRAVERALGLVASQAAFFNIDLQREYEPDMPPVMADDSEVQQVLLNIILNAVQAMDEHGRMMVRTRRANGCGEVLISDSGRGIPHDQIDRVFDPFFTTKGETHGTGLGLSIAYGIVAKHGGTISVESEPGKGTTFTVRLPLAPSFLAADRESASLNSVS